MTRFFHEHDPHSSRHPVQKWAALAVLALLLTLPLPSGAAVKGICSDCHTMHNSQQGSVVAFTRDASGQAVLREQAFGMLLKTDCLGCHSHAGPETIVTLGESRVPIVLNLTEPAYPPDGSAGSTLAGGNFHWVVRDGDPHGHNVRGISTGDPRFSKAPGDTAGVQDCATCHKTLATPQGGCNGCHVAQHHADGPGALAGREQGWYRFLGAVMQRDGGPEPTAEGVVGIEDPDWERSPLPNRHNVYQGSTVPGARYLDTGSISQKCAGCHGRFHSQTAGDSVWIRHPVDAVIPTSGEFTDFTTYDPLVPVARPNVTAEDANFAVINRGSDLVACISCHRPHGSPYPSLLRWNYRAWPGTDPHTGQPALNGCAVCHTAKD